MKIKKEIPAWYIIGDTKINQNSFQRLSDENGDTEFETRWLHNNGKLQSISNMEKLLEYLANEFLEIPNKEGLPNHKFIEKNFNKLEPLFDNFFVTVYIKNISHRFIKEMLLSKINNFSINQKTSSDLSLWLPPICQENEKLQIHYGYLVGEILKSIDEFTVKGNEFGADKKKLIEAALNMMPQAQHCKASVSASILTWRKLFLEKTTFGTDDETRYVFMHLCRDMKMRYFSFFMDIVAESDTGQQLGVDTIVSDSNIWNKFRLTKLRG